MDYILNPATDPAAWAALAAMAFSVITEELSMLARRARKRRAGTV